MNLSVCRSYVYFSIALVLTPAIALPGQCQQKKPKPVVHPPVAASKKNDASVAAFQAAFSGNLVKLKGIVSSKGGILMQDKDGKTLLHHAVIGGRMAVVRWLVSQKIPLNTTDASGVSALAFARQNTSDADMEERRAEIIRFLQEQGAQEIGKAPEPPISDVRETKNLGPVEGSPASLIKLLGKSRQEVERVLGTPTSESSYKGGPYLYWGPGDNPTSSSACWDINGQMVELNLPCASDWRKSLAKYGLSDAGVRTTKIKGDYDLDAYRLSNVKGVPDGWNCNWFRYSLSFNKAIR